MSSQLLDELLLKGQGFNFRNNCYSSNGEEFSKASDELLAWIARVEDFVINNYGENSAPFKLYKTLNRRHLNGNYQTDFERQLSILHGVLKACKDIPIRKASLSHSNQLNLNNLLDKFHDVVKQLRNRHNSRNTLDVDDEYDVQDLLHALLKLYFEDIRKEEWTPSYAGGSCRMDFLLKMEKTVIEVKKTRAGLGDKELGKQLIEDKAKYQVHHDCKKLICFVYDPEGRIVNPKGIQNDLNSSSEDFKVEIIIKP
jgi:hypothetical protein